MVETYLCPGCDGEVIVGKPCTRCRRPKKKKREPKKSWEQDSIYDGMDLPEDDFDYEEFLEKEFDQRPHKQIGIAFHWWITAVVLLLACAFLFLRLG